MEANKKKNSDENQNHEDCHYRKNDFVNGNRQGVIFATYPLGPESPSPATLRMLPALTPGGILTLILFLIRTRPSPEHLRQFSEMISPSPPQFGHTETYDMMKEKGVNKLSFMEVGEQMKFRHHTRTCENKPNGVCSVLIT